MLTETLTAPTELLTEAWWRDSEAGMCPTLLCHKKLGHEALPMSVRVRHMLDDGRAHERDIVERFRNGGATVLHALGEQVEVVSSEHPHVRGHPDGLLDLPKDFPRDLDRWDEDFKFDLRFYLLEITAPNHFVFQRVKTNGLRDVLLAKFVQIQRYLSSPAIRSYTDCCIAEVKNKNTSELYEEGISFDEEVVKSNNTQLLVLEDLLTRSEVSSYRCDDWRQNTCQYRHLCFEEVQPEPTLFAGALVGENLAEAKELLEAVGQWKRGKQYKDLAEEMVEESREYFRSILKEYGAPRLSIQDVVAQIFPQTRRSADLDYLKKHYPKVYEAVVSQTVSEVLRVV